MLLDRHAGAKCNQGWREIALSHEPADRLITMLIRPERGAKETYSPKIRMDRSEVLALVRDLLEVAAKLADQEG